MLKLLAPPVASLLFASSACAQEPQPAQDAPPPAASGAVTAHDADGEDGPPTPAGVLQANWRVTRPHDPADGAVMRLHLIHDGDRLQGSYVLFQPFCWIDRPLPQPLDDDCEFTDLSAEFEGVVRDGRARIVIRPGADGLDHVLTFTVSDGEWIEGVYAPPGAETTTPIVLQRQDF